MKIRDEAAAKAKADAIKAGKTEAEAEAIGKIAGLEAENAWYAGEQTKGIEERQTLKRQLQEAEPFIARGKKAADDEKDAGTRLAELQAEIGKRDAALLSERRSGRLRDALVKAGVRPDRMDAAMRLANADGLTYDEKTGTFSGLDEAAGAVAKDYPEFVGDQAPSRSPGGELPNKGGGSTIKAEDLVAGDDVGALNANRAEIKAGKKSIA